MKILLTILVLSLCSCASIPFDRTYSISFADQAGATASLSATFGAAKVIKLPKPSKK